MRKTSSLTTAAILSFCLLAFACSNLQSERTASVSFDIPKCMIQKSDAPQAVDGQDANGLMLDIALKGAYSEQKTVRVDDGGAVIFSAVPVGAQIWAEAAAYKIEGQEKTILYKGKSSVIVVAEGQNPLSITMKRSGSDTPEPGPDPAPDTSIKIYVSAQEGNPAGSDETGDGTKEMPLATIEAAIQKINDAQKDWTIVVLGSISSAETIEFPESVAALSITVKGEADGDGNAPFVKNTSNTKSLFAVNSSVPLVFKDITLDMTKQPSSSSTISGLIFNVAAGADLTLGSGAKLVSSTDTTDLPSRGNGAIYSKGTVKLESGSLISDFKTNMGGGIYVDGGTVTMNGGKIARGHTRYGGGVYVNAGSFEMNGDSVIGGDDDSDACEALNYGGGVYVKSSGSFTMNGNAKISKCKSKNSASSIDGGGVWSEGSFTMNGGTICDNVSGGETYKGKGGGVYIKGSSGVFTMNGGSIFGNTNASKGSGVYVGSGATFKIKGDAFVADGNDVYLEDGRKITIAGALAKKYVANIVVPELSDASMSPLDKTVLDLAAGADTTLPKEFNKFTMPQNDYNSAMECCVIQSDGTVGSLAAGDIVFTDGTAVAYSDTLSMDDERKAKAAAVIFYVGSACTDDTPDTRTLGVGLKQKSGVAWCSGDAYGKDNAVMTTMCEGTKNADGSYTFETGAVKDGSGNFEKMKTAYGSNYNAEDYPAYEWVNAYSSDATSLAGTDCAGGWYIPSVCEMAYLYLGLKNSRVNDALELCGGTKFDWTETNPGTANNYWSSSQYSGGPESLERFNFNGGILSGGGMKTYDSAKFCAVREF